MNKVYDWTRAIVMIVALVFLILLVIKNPFEATHSMTFNEGEQNEFTIQADDYPAGHGMNPMLRNIWMVIHPPVLFIGYAFVTIPFAASLAYSITNDRKWTEISTQWSRLAWLFLTLGIGIGGLWAYIALGWGGYWAWDPVEVGSLVPWITLSAFLHTQLMNKRKNQYGIITPILGTLTFLLIIFATFITRSGMWESVHSWTETEIGWVLLITMIGTIILSSIIIIISFILRFQKGTYDGFFENTKKFNWDSLSMLGSVIIFVLLTIIVFIGLIMTMRKPNIALYETSLAPAIFILLGAMAVCLGWRYLGKENTVYAISWALLLGIACAVFLPMYLFPGDADTFYKFEFGSITSHNIVGFIIPLVFLMIIAAIFKIVKSINRKSIRATLKAISPHIIHIGVALIILAYGASQTMVVEGNERLRVGDTMEVGDYKIKLIEIKIEENTGDLDSNEYWDTWYVTVEIYKNNEFVQEGYLEMTYGYSLINYYNNLYDIRKQIFSLDVNYLNYLDYGPVDETIRDVFESNLIFLSNDAIITSKGINEEHFKFRFDDDGKINGTELLRNYIKIENRDNIYLIENVGTRLNVYGLRNYETFKTSEIFVGQMPLEDVYLSFSAIIDNMIEIRAKTIPMMSFLWGGMWLFTIGIVIRLAVDYLPPKTRELEDAGELRRRMPPRRVVRRFGTDLKPKRDKKYYEGKLEEELKKLRG
ncbi:MAG: cytochrome c biogenesis protein CcsA [Thermoplasmata archaeon]|nr:cytochrome c biogenesis protein CcsA [Thermoplasmata archaeon]